MSWNIKDEMTHAESVSPDYEKRRDDVSFLILSGPDEGRRHLVKPPGGIIGRDPKAIVSLRDPKVSGQHAKIEFSKDGRVMLSDLGSKNGVFVNSVQVARAEVFDGNNIRLSNDTVLRVRFQDPAETELLQRLQGSATVDPVTGLPNRRYVLERLHQELSFATRHGDAVTVALFDVDDFQKVLDVDGQTGGDILVRELAGLVRELTRFEDVVARFGHDELLVLLRHTDEDAAQRYANRVQAALADRTFRTGDVPIVATCTIGLATFHPEAREVTADDRATSVAALASGDQVHELLSHAEQAVFRGKTDGKDRIVIWDGPTAS